MLAPMALTLAWAQGVLTAGAPRWLRDGLVAPLAANGALRGLFGFLAQPAVATLLYIAALYAWQVPAYHNLALRNEALHYAMHASMLAAGLLFWWRIFDRRAAPQGCRYGVRLMMLWVVILSNIALGAVITLHRGVLYAAYDDIGRLFGMAARADEEIGGVIIWIPSSMMCLLAVLAVIHLWGRQETRQEARREAGHAAPLRPTTAAQLVAERAPRNRAMAIGFATFAITVFASAIVAGVLNELAHREGQVPVIQHAAHHQAGPS
jgi:putative membrane protein